MNPNTSFLFKKYIAQASDFTPFILDVEKAEGIYIWDKQGKKYVDFISSICVNNVGHRNPKVMEALHQQLEKYMHVMVYGEFIQQPQLDFAQRLIENLPPHFEKIFFLNCGSEAIEGAIKLARLYNQRKQIISFANSYHGSTMGAMSIVGDTKFQRPFSPLLPYTKSLRFNSIKDIELITEDTCCVVAEVIQSGSGMTPATQEFLQKLRAKCTQVGALLIFDEIQSGFGRTGKLFAFEHYGLHPDILCIAKGMGGGMPIGAFVSSAPLMDLLQGEHPLLGHASTFGGHPLSCVSALASLNLILEADFLNQIPEKEKIIRSYLENLTAIEKVQGKGLFLSAFFKQAHLAEKVVEKCIENGLITLWLLFNHDALALTPPLTITNEELHTSMQIFVQSIHQALEENDKL